MSYYSRRRNWAPVEKVFSPELEARLKEFRWGSTHEYLTDWEKGFCESVTEAYEKYKGLTPRQVEVFEKIEKKYSPDNIAARSHWADEFDAEKRTILKKVAEYYSDMPYFGEAVQKILNDEDWTPSETLWNKMVENKYAQKMLAADAAEAKFAKGGLALLRDTFSGKSSVGFWGTPTAMPMSFTERKGRAILVLKESGRRSLHKVYTCCFLDTPLGVFEVEERWLKKHRAPKKKN
jgi:hypothetical protein